MIFIDFFFSLPFTCLSLETKIQFIMENNDECDALTSAIQTLIAHNQRNRSKFLFILIPFLFVSFFLFFFFWKAFGVPIETLIERDKQKIPTVVTTLVEFVEKEGINTVGLFRIPGTATSIKRVKTLFNQSNGYFFCFFYVEWK